MGHNHKYKLHVQCAGFDMWSYTVCWVPKLIDFLKVACESRTSWWSLQRVNLFKQTTKYKDVYMQQADLFCKDLYPADRLKHVLQCDVQTTTSARQCSARGMFAQFQSWFPESTHEANKGKCGKARHFASDCQLVSVWHKDYVLMISDDIISS